MRFSASSTTSASVESTKTGAGTRVAIFSRMEEMYPFSSSPTIAQQRSSMCEPSFTSFFARARMSSYFFPRTRLRKCSTRVVVFISSATIKGLGSRSRGTDVYALEAAATGLTSRLPGSTPETASTTAFRCSAVVPQHPPTMRTP
jgi:hypothetical protein